MRSLKHFIYKKVYNPCEGIIEEALKDYFQYCVVENKDEQAFFSLNTSLLNKLRFQTMICKVQNAKL